MILTAFDPDEYVYEALRAGASAFVLEEIPPADLARAIRAEAPPRVSSVTAERSVCTGRPHTAVPGYEDVAHLEGGQAWKERGGPVTHDS